MMLTKRVASKTLVAEERGGRQQVLVFYKAARARQRYVRRNAACCLEGDGVIRGMMRGVVVGNA